MFQASGYVCNDYWRSYYSTGFQTGMAVVGSPGENQVAMDPDGRLTPFGEWNPYADCFSEGLAALMTRIGDDYPTGYVDRYIKFVIKPQYDHAEDFHDGLALVTKDGKTGYIDPKGKLVIPFDYDECERCLFEGGVCHLWKKGKVGLIDRSGKVLIPFRYDYIKDFFGAEETVAQKGDTTYVFNRKGKKLHALRLNPAFGLHIGGYGEGLFSVYTEQFKYHGPLKDGFQAYNRLTTWGYVDLKGKLVIPVKYDYVGRFVNDLANVQKGKKYGIIDKRGKTVLALRYDAVWRDADGLYLATRGHTLEIYDKDAKLILATEFEALQEDAFYGDFRLFGEGLLSLRRGDKWGYIDMNGKVIVPFRYTAASPFREGLAAVHDGTTWRVLKNPLPTKGA